MAKKTISELDSKSGIADTDVFVIDTGTHNYKVPLSLLKSVIKGIYVTNFTTNSENGSLTLRLSNGDVFTVTPHDPTKQDLMTPITDEEIDAICV